VVDNNPDGVLNAGVEDVLKRLFIPNRSLEHAIPQSGQKQLRLVHPGLLRRREGLHQDTSNRALQVEPLAPPGS